MRFEAIVMGLSSGGMNAMRVIFSNLPKDFKTPVIVVQHLGAHSSDYWIKLLNDRSNLMVKEADEKESIERGKIYIAPANYHLLIEKDKTFSLTIGEHVNYSRPSIDVLFESAAEAFTNKLIGIILTGSNHDGTNGIKRVKECGGLTIIQNPETAESAYMPKSAIAAIKPDYVLSLEDITELLITLDKQKENENDT